MIHANELNVGDVIKAPTDCTFGLPKGRYKVMSMPYTGFGVMLLELLNRRSGRTLKFHVACHHFVEKVK